MKRRGGLASGVPYTVGGGVNSLMNKFPKILEYPESGVVYLVLRNALVVAGKDIGDNVHLDFDAAGNVVGIEVLAYELFF